MTFYHIYDLSTYYFHNHNTPRIYNYDMRQTVDSGKRPIVRNIRYSTNPDWLDIHEFQIRLFVRAYKILICL